MLPSARQGDFSPEGLLRAIATLFSCCLSIRLFCYDPIICSKIFLPLSHPVVDMALPILPQIVGRIFFVFFGTSCFIYIVWSCLGIFLVFLLSSVFLVGLLKLFLFLVAVLFQFRPNISYCSVLVFLLVVVVLFLSAIQVWVPTWVLTFFLWSSRGPRSFHRLILLPHILNCLTPWCCLPS